MLLLPQGAHCSCSAQNSGERKGVWELWALPTTASKPQKWMVRSQTQPCKEPQPGFKLALSCCVHHTYNKMLHVKKYSYLSWRSHNNCDSVLIKDTKKEKEEYWAVSKKRKKSYIYSLYTILYNIILHKVLSVIFRVIVPLQKDTPNASAILLHFYLASKINFPLFLGRSSSAAGCYWTSKF